MKHKKIIITFAVFYGFLILVEFFSTFQTYHQYIHDVSNEQLLSFINYDYTKYVTLPENFEKMKINKSELPTLNDYISDYLEDNPYYESTEKKIVEENDKIHIEYSEEKDEIGFDVFITVSADDDYFNKGENLKFIGKEVGKQYPMKIKELDDDGENIVTRNYFVKIQGIYKERILKPEELNDQIFIDHSYVGDAYSSDENLTQFKNSLNEIYVSEKDEAIREQIMNYMIQNSKFTNLDEISEKLKDYATTTNEVKEILIEDALIKKYNIHYTKEEVKEILSSSLDSEYKDYILGDAEDKACNILYKTVAKNNNITLEEIK